MRISDWSSDVCSSDLGKGLGPGTVVLINELGDIGLDHARVLHLSDKVVLLDSGCLCCAVRGELVGALRQLFLDALHKRIPSFSRVIIETTGIADPAPVIYTLRYDHFLAEPYLYGGSSVWRLVGKEWVSSDWSSDVCSSDL